MRIFEYMKYWPSLGSLTAKQLRKRKETRKCSISKSEQTVGFKNVD
jgi:hypothetical protein